MDQKNIVLFGYGNFGRHLYKNLSAVKHTIKVISTNEEYIKKADEDGIAITQVDIKKNDDIRSLHIDPEKDLLYCAMNKTANNLFLVLTLRTLFPSANIIAISNSFENTRKLKYAGADSIIDLYEATSRRVINILTKPAVIKALDEIIYKQSNLQMAEIVLPKNSFLEAQLVKEIPFKKMGIILIAIIDKELSNELIFTDHRINHKLDAGDTLVMVAKEKDLHRFKEKIKIKAISSL